MDIGSVLANIKADTLRQIGEAANENNTARVLEIGRRLQAIESLSSQHSDLVTAVDALLESSEQPNDIPSPRQNGVSPKAHAKQRRHEIVEQLKASGATLKPIQGVIYLAPSGARVGLPFATEGESNRWFFGLQEGTFDQAVLLCEAKDGEVITLSLGRDFFAKYGTSLSSSKGQVKFNVVRRGSSFEVVIPNIGKVRVDANRNNYKDMLS